MRTGTPGPVRTQQLFNNNSFYRVLFDNSDSFDRCVNSKYNNTNDCKEQLSLFFLSKLRVLAS